MTPTYISRLHDEMLVGLFRAMRKGNFLLTGLRGNGKTSALMRFSDVLIDARAEFSMVPFSPEGRRFVAPFGKINLIDDVELQLSRELVAAIEQSRKSALNIMTANLGDLEGLRKQITIDGVIEIRTLSNEEQSSLISDWHKANKIDRGLEESRRALRAYVEGKKHSPGELRCLLRSIENSSVAFLKSATQSDAIELVRPRIMLLNKKLTEAVRRNPKRLDELSAVQFEEFIAELFEENGYKVTLTKKSRDGGIDVIAEKADVIDLAILAQCKKYAPHRPIGAQVIREMTGVLDINKAAAGAVFTTSRFTATAIEEAKVIRHRMSLLDYFDILMCLHKSGKFNL
jgi:hypothetical protein